MLNISAVQVDLKLLSKFEKNLPGVPSTTSGYTVFGFTVTLENILENSYLYKKKKVIEKERRDATRTGSDIAFPIP